MTPKEMREKRANLITQARGLRDEIEAKGTTEARAAELEAQFDKMISEAEALEERAKKAEKLAEMEASLDAGDPRRPVGDEARGAGAPAPHEISYREAFHQLMLAGGDRSEMAAEARAALAGGQVQLSPEQRAQVAGTAAAGGNLVPDEAMRAIVKAMAAWGPMFDDDFATVLKTDGGGNLPIPGVDDTAKEAQDNGSEGQPLTDDGGQDAVFTKNELGDYMIDTEWLRVSIQLATSGMESMEALLGQLLGERLGRKANRALTVGTGTGEALGIVAAAAASGVTVASNAAISADELLGLYHSVDPAYRASPKFGAMFNDNTLLAVHKLKDGQGNYLVSEAPDGQGRIRIGGVTMRYKINQAMADIGASARSVVAGDMSKYFVRKIGGVIIGTDRGQGFWPGFGIAGYTRFDGALADARAVKSLVHPV
ncbi:phage major capsid protein [Phaeobacter gallaeciensis]|uniref:phage major capsid protein n=1 Tax=Phaeobacter gallaeciensis TaxID=60890 RepID=UPI00237FA68D|nr:phage major capsid protein [Phaeobacter gallaeciensis]MDE4059765.1 phage major capsid protein [Phaeobacter gallaeciensis]MDE4122598.1 phage major capsid protein [Phaeobacter gallaeciensis]MDE4127253.1 phage major capsid protein [Phaeobacter gallaeciensis]